MSTLPPFPDSTITAWGVVHRNQVEAVGVDDDDVGPPYPAERAGSVGEAGGTGTRHRRKLEDVARVASGGGSTRVAAADFWTDVSADCVHAHIIVM
jgi:hypothetical protein